MTPEGEFFWWAGRGAQPEDYTAGPFGTREEAIQVGRVDFDGEGFTVIEARKGKFSPPSADDLMGEWSERWGDDDIGREDYPEFAGPAEAIKAAEADLDALLANWFERHRKIMPEPWCFAETRNEEFFPGTDDGEA